MNIRKILAIGSDHAGFKLKEELNALLKTHGYEVEDVGTFSEESADYPDYAHKVCAAVLQGRAQTGILLCGSGNGINMAANRHNGIRAALCWKPEIARLAKQHNDANILALPARFVSYEEAVEILNAFLKTPFEGGRHQKRISKINIT